MIRTFVRSLALAALVPLAAACSSSSTSARTTPLCATPAGTYAVTFAPPTDGRCPTVPAGMWTVDELGNIAVDSTVPDKVTLSIHPTVYDCHLLAAWETAPEADAANCMGDFVVSGYLNGDFTEAGIVSGTYDITGKCGTAQTEQCFYRYAGVRQ